MKKIFFLLTVLLSFLQINAQMLSRTMLIDFGPAAQTDSSKVTTNPDLNNNYWNNFTGNTASTAALELKDKTNVATGISIKTLVDFSVNANPGACGLKSLSLLNVAALGDMAIPTATMDYFFIQTATPSLKFTGLSASKGYKFYVYGCRVASDNRISQYTFTGAATTVGTLQTSGSLLGGAGINANNSSTYATPILFADANGEIKLELLAKTGGFGYINIIKVEEYSGVGTVKVTDITVSGNSTIETDGGTAQMTATVLPENATVKGYNWSVSDPKIAIISPLGLLTAQRNGAVVVTATATEAGSTVSGSKQVVISNQSVATKEMFLDLGPNDGTNGDLTPATADANGNFWNNATANAPGGISPVPSTLVANVVDKSNLPTNISVVLTAASLKTNGKLNGALLTPNANYLGELAIATATEDYFFAENGSGTLTFRGLDNTKAYRFKIFGSRESTETRISKFTLTGANVVIGSHQTSGANLGGAGVNRNVSYIYSSELVYPAANGEITLNVANQQSSFAYINAMKIEEFDKAYVPVTALSVSGSDIAASGATAQMTATVSPENASVAAVVWTVDYSSVAAIDANGLLHPLKNGTVNVTATSKQTGTTISATKQINITNQFSVLYLSGTATENGDNVSTAPAMKRLTDGQGYPTGIFEIYTTLNDAGTLNFYSSQSNDAIVYGGAGGTLAESGPAVDPTESGLALISVNMPTKTYSILPTSTVEVAGAAGAVQLTYKGQGVWSGLVNMGSVVTDADLKFSFRINSDANYSFKRITGSINTLRMESTAISLGIPVEKIPTDKNSYMVSFDLNNYTYSIACPTLNNLKIAYMGSSVASGTGAYLNRGYNYLYTNILSTRYAASQGLNFTTVNISIGGNNTLNLLARIGTDLFPLCAKYVIFGLSLGNEGIHGSANQEATFNQFKNNMQTLIAMARAKGLTPVMTNNYTRNDYTLTDYSYIKRINMLIHQWDLPTVNLLGAVDTGTGLWATGYWSDALHPNDAGHAEFSYSMIPSMFDALEAGKPLPVRATGNSMTFANGSTSNQLQYTPDNTLHSFTHSFEFKTSQSGTLSTFKTTGALKIDAETGAIAYTSPLTAAQIKGTSAVNDNKWHRVTLTHYYARGESALYIDSTYVGKINERMVANNFKLNDLQGPAEVSFRDWFFYRAGMNREEISAICAGKMLKSGLELYAPLYGQATAGEQLKNIAQSTTIVNKVELSATAVPSQFAGVKLYPNPVQHMLKIDGLNNGRSYEYAIYGMDGRIIQASITSNAAAIDVSLLPASYYVLVVTDQISKEKLRLSFSKF